MLRTTSWQPVIRRTRTRPWARLNHGLPPKPDDPNSSQASKPDPHSLSTELGEKGQQSVFQVEPKPSRAAPAQFDASAGIKKLLWHNKKPYLPKLRHERLSFEYPGLPNQDDFTKHSNQERKPKKVTRWSRHVPKLLTAAVLVWAAYAVKVWLYPVQDDSDSNDLLDPNHFHKFVVTHKQQIDKDHFLVEVRPKYLGWKMSYYAHYDNKSIWNGDIMWSVEIKQPQIMVVRSYTPLPLYFLQSERSRSGEKEPLLKVIENDSDDYDKGGVMTFYIKRYGDGEVSRYISDKNVGDELDIRGPHVQYRFPYHPLKALHERPIFRDLPSRVEPETLLEAVKLDHGIPDYDSLNFYGAGTGIAPILQVLLSRNPYRGFVNVHYSAKSVSELEPLKRFMFFLEMLDRARFHEHIDLQPRSRLSSADIGEPVKPNYISPMRAEELAGGAEGENADRIRQGSKNDENSGQGEETNNNEKKKSLESLRFKMAILNTDEEVLHSRPQTKWYQNALAQAQDTSRHHKSDAALAIVCGPDGYIDYVAGAKDLATGEQGPVRGLLGAKNWDNSNVVKL